MTMNNPSKVSIILNTAAYDRVSYALSIANVSAANLKDVAVLFTYGAVLRLREDEADEIGEETAAWIRPSVQAGVEHGTIPRISEMLDFAKGFGVTLYACSAAVAFHHLDPDALPLVDEVIGIARFLEEAEGGPILYV
jgi:peroxiredoxin family protein